MPNPLKVSLENIIPLTEARDHFSQIVNEVQKDKLYVLTKGGKPAVAIVDVKYLEAITGGNVNQGYVKEEIKKAPEKVGLATMIQHKNNSYDSNAPFSAPKPAPKPFTPPTQPAPATPPKPATPTPLAAQPSASPTPTIPAAPKPVSPPPSSPTTPPLAKTPTPPSTMPNPSGASSGTPTVTTSGQPFNNSSPNKPTPTPSGSPTPTPVTPPQNNNDVIETSSNPFIPNSAPAPSAPAPSAPVATSSPSPANSTTPSSTPISVNFSPDYNEKEDKIKPGQANPDDKPGPAQYSGPPANNDKEPDDMAID